MHMAGLGFPPRSDSRSSALNQLFSNSLVSSLLYRLKNDRGFQKALADVASVN